MPRKKPKLPENYAKMYAIQRRLSLLSKADGVKLLELLGVAGVRYRVRGNAACSHVTLEPDQFVIDIASPPASDEANSTTKRPDGQGDSNVG